MSKKVKMPSLEEALLEINGLIEAMEHQQLSLEQSLEKFERGISLIKHCQGILQEAEHKVQILMQNNGKEELKPFETATE